MREARYFYCVLLDWWTAAEQHSGLNADARDEHDIDMQRVIAGQLLPLAWECAVLCLDLVHSTPYK